MSDDRRRSERLQRKKQNPTTTSSMLLQDLPDDVLVHQLAPQLCLPGKHVLSAVCRKWRGLSDWQSLEHVCTKLGGDGHLLLQALGPTRPMVLLWGSIQEEDRRKAVVRRLCAVLASPASNVGTLYAMCFGLTKGMATLLGDALQSSRCLRALVLDHNRSFSPSGVRRIAAALEEGNIPLEELSLRRVNVCDSGAIALGRALARNRTLLILDLTEGDIRMAGVVAFAQALGGRNRTLRRLTLSRNGVAIAKHHGYTHCHAALLALCEALQHTHLTDLNMDATIGAADLHACAPLLLAHHLRRLDLSHHVAAALFSSCCAPLTDLTLRYCMIDARRASALAVALPASLRCLDVSNNPIYDADGVDQHSYTADGVKDLLTAMMDKGAEILVDYPCDQEREPMVELVRCLLDARTLHSVYLVFGMLHAQ